MPIFKCPWCNAIMQTGDKHNCPKAPRAEKIFNLLNLEGNCFAACLQYITKLPMEELMIVVYGRDGVPDAWWEDTVTYLNGKGYHALFFPIKEVPEMFEYIKQNDDYYILAGKSAEHPERGHAVVGIHDNLVFAEETEILEPKVAWVLLKMETRDSSDCPVCNLQRDVDKKLLDVTES